MKNDIVEDFSPPSPLKTSVLFLVFNRLDTTKKVFEAIRKAKPPRLYLASDGARKNKDSEDKIVETVRQYVLQNIDWECEVKTLFREHNLGCKYAVSSAIDWFFGFEEEGIILEDDCLPSQSFFWYCEELLLKYKNDLRVWHISGNNFQNGKARGDGSYYFSRFNHVWGWACWANRWENYDVKMKTYDKFFKVGAVGNIFDTKKELNYWQSCFSGVVKNDIDTWDYQWTYTMWVNNGLSILPNKNMISNIGFGPEATHTTSLNSQFSRLERGDIRLPLRHPLFMIRNVIADRHTSRAMFKSASLISRVINRIKRIFE